MMVRPIVVRPIEEKDVRDVTLLCAQLGYPSADEQIMARVAALLKHKDHRVFVAETPGGEVIGYVHVEGRQFLVTGPFAQICALVMAEGHRGQGVGQALMDVAEQWSRDQGYGEMLVYTNIVRVRAHRFYRRIGYASDKTSHVFHKKL